ncbi:LysR family transcriptional regulator [Burkholderia gladioli]|uniref:LysR family transcriptional regulator n=1 Tax=Burkholderia gladioli TaxID=28095 RepID=UPI0015609F65|nr:LysR family transcriptional regulator [Burkholderia gladioli]NRF86801.1 LysR family transcriptional regulator [Burkholderia gladioli]
MDSIDAMRLFVRIVERRSFTAAANDTDIPRSTATQVIRQMEDRLGVRLLQRTTRTVTPTLDGEAYYRSCMSILDDLHEAEAALGGKQPRGMLRVDVQGTLARHFLLPALPEFFRRFPELQITMSESDRFINLVEEGVDCVLRYGVVQDTELVARKVATLERLTVAAPAYLEVHGRPDSIEALETGTHRMVGVRTLSTGRITPLEFVSEGDLRHVVLPDTLSVTGPESYRDSTLLGLGIAQMPRFHIEADLASGRLVTLLESTPPPSMPVWLLYPHRRQLSPRVRAFLDWAANEFTRRQRDAAALDGDPGM